MKSIFFALAISLCTLCNAQTPTEHEWITEYVDTIPNFPIPGIQFKWYSKLMKNPDAFHRVIKIFADHYSDRELDAIVGLDSRGFIFGTALAYEMKLPFIVVRKGGKLPGDTISHQFNLEYGTATFEIEKGILQSNDRVVIIDDVLATGGTLKAAAHLVEELGATVDGIACFGDIPFLKGKENLPYPVFSLIEL